MFKQAKGLTLVEVMIAMVILLMVSLALMQTALVSIQSNTKGEVRDEAVKLADRRITWLRDKGFASPEMTGGTVAIPVKSEYKDTATVRNAPVPYVETVRVTDLDPATKQVEVKVTWQWKGDTYSHSLSTIVKR